MNRFLSVLRSLVNSLIANHSLPCLYSFGLEVTWSFVILLMFVVIVGKCLAVNFGVDG